MATVFSYLRFSTKEQEAGTSLERQHNAAVEWCKRKGHHLDTSLKADKGRSAYKGDHRRVGNLGKFLDQVMAGRVPPGSILLVEEISRLGREAPMTTLTDTLKKLWDNGITIQTISPEYDYPPGCSNEPKFIILTILLQQASLESERKAHFITEAREIARKQAQTKGRFLTGRVPAWLVPTYVQNEGDKRPRITKVEPIPAAAETIKYIFELKLSGLGLPAIEAKLNKEKGLHWTPPLSKGQKTTGWRQSYIKKILRNPAVIGICQHYHKKMVIDKDGEEVLKRVPIGPPLQKHFPLIVPKELYYAVTKSMDFNRGKGGETGKCRNLLALIAKCGYCGGPMVHVRTNPTDRYSYLVCDNGRRKVKCERRFSMQYPEIEGLILENCVRLDPSQVLANPKASDKKSKQLRLQLDGLVMDLAATEKKAANLLNATLETEDKELLRMYQSKVIELNNQKAEIAKKQELTKALIAQAETGLERLDTWKADLETLRVNLKDGTDPDIRPRLRAHLKELICRIRVFAFGPNGDDKGERFIQLFFQPFDVLRDGVTLVPEGSTAGGAKWNGKKWEPVNGGPMLASHYAPGIAYTPDGDLIEDLSR